MISGFLDQELLSLKKFEEYKPVDAGTTVPKIESKTAEPPGKYMVLGRHLLIIYVISFIFGNGYLKMRIRFQYF